MGPEGEQADTKIEVEETGGLWHSHLRSLKKGLRGGGSVAPSPQSCAGVFLRARWRKALLSKGAAVRM